MAPAGTQSDFLVPGAAPGKRRCADLAAASRTHGGLADVPGVRRALPDGPAKRNLYRYDRAARDLQLLPSEASGAVRRHRGTRERLPRSSRLRQIVSNPRRVLAV